MSTINDTDLVLVNRAGSSYKTQFSSFDQTGILLFSWPSTSSSGITNYPANLQDVLDNGTPLTLGQYSGEAHYDLGIIMVISPNNSGYSFTDNSCMNPGNVWNIGTGNNATFFNADGTVRPATHGSYNNSEWQAFMWYPGDGTTPIPNRKCDSNAAYMCMNLGEAVNAANTNVVGQPLPPISGGVEDTDLLLVNRAGSSFKCTWENAKTKIQAADLLLIERAGASYKVTGEDFLSAATITQSVTATGTFRTLNPPTPTTPEFLVQGLSDNGTPISDNINPDGSVINTGWKPNYQVGPVEMVYDPPIDCPGGVFSFYSGAYSNAPVQTTVYIYYESGQEELITLSSGDDKWFQEFRFTGVNGRKVKRVNCTGGGGYLTVGGATRGDNVMVVDGS